MFLVPFDFSKPPAIALRGYSVRWNGGLKRNVKWYSRKHLVKSMNDIEKVKAFMDDNLFQLSDILVSARDGQNKSIDSPEHWLADIGLIGNGLYNILNPSLFKMGTADAPMLMEINQATKIDILIFDPNFFFYSKIEV